MAAGNAQLRRPGLFAPPGFFRQFGPTWLKLGQPGPFTITGPKLFRLSPFNRMPELFQNPTDLATSLPIT